MKYLTKEKIDSILTNSKYLPDSDEKRFWSKVDVKGPDDCWEWIGCLNTKGYGQFCLHKNRTAAHRIAFISTGKMKDRNNCVLHKCDNPLCCNPKHLFEGTQSDNLIDMIKKGRCKSGVRKLNSEAVKVIKWMLKYRPRRGLSAKLAQLYNVNHVTISDIKRNKTWHHIKV